MPEGNVNGFFHLSKSKLHKNDIAMGLPCAEFTDEIMFGNYPEAGGGPNGEVAVRWYKVGGLIVPQLEIFDDAFHYFTDFADVFKDLTELGGVDGCCAITPDRFCEFLKKHGFLDLTK